MDAGLVDIAEVKKEAALLPERPEKGGDPFRGGLIFAPSGEGYRNLILRKTRKPWRCWENGNLASQHG